MKSNVIVTIVVVILIAAVGGYYFMNRTSETPVTPSDSIPEASISRSSTTTEKTSLKSFMSMGGNQKCEFFDSGNQSGNIYLNSGRMRGDFISKVDNKETTTHMINDGSSVYIWMDDQTSGFKTTLESIEQMNQTEGVTGVSKTVDINKKLDYKCENWSADEAKFIVPADVKFQDTTKMLQDAAKMMQKSSPNVSALPLGNVEACSACGNLEGDAQTQCKKALKCD